MTIQPATQDDLQQILSLQRRAFQSEPEMLSTPDIPPLRQTLADLQREFTEGVILKLTDESGEIVGSVRAHRDGGAVQIEKLMVEPELRGRGYGTQLLAAAEQALPATRYELFTSAMSERNIQMYKQAGYRIYQQKRTADGLEMVFFVKHIH